MKQTTSLNMIHEERAADNHITDNHTQSSLISVTAPS